MEVAGSTDGETAYVNANGETRPLTLGPDGSFSTTVPLHLGENQVTVVAQGADGGTTIVRRTVTSTSLGDEVGTVADPAGDDNGPGSYVYPTNAAFSDGAFDVRQLGVYDDGGSVNFAVTLDGATTNPWGGNQMSVQRFDLYLRPAGFGVPARRRHGPAPTPTSRRVPAGDHGRRLLRHGRARRLRATSWAAPR